MHRLKLLLGLILVLLGTVLTAEYQVPRETVIAEFTGGKILYGDIEDRIAKIPPMYQTKYKTEEGMNSLLDMMCTEEVFYLEAVAKDLQNSGNFQEHSDMQTMSLLKNEYRKDLLDENISLSETEKQEFFQQHAEDYYAGRIYEEVASDVENRLRSEKEQEYFNNYYNELTEKYNITINNSSISKIDLTTLENNESILTEKIFTSSIEFIEKDVNYLILIFPELSPQQKQSLTDQNALTTFINDMAQTWTLAYEAIEKGYKEREDIKETITQIKRNVMLRSVYNILVVDAVQLSDDEIMAYYNDHIADFSSKATRKIQVFSFTEEEKAEKILKKARKALKKNKIEELNKLVNENCTYTNNNGIISNIYNNGIIPGFGKDEIFAEKVWLELDEDNPGKFTDIFPINKGEYVFFRILEDNQAEPQPFQEVKDRIAAKLNKDMTRAKFDEVSAQLKEKYDVVTYNDRLFVVLPAEEYFNFAEEAQKKRRYQDAIYYYDKVIKNHKNNVDDYKAMFMKGFLYAEELNKKDLALEVFNELLQNYEEGDLHESARFMIDELEGKSNIIESFEDTGETKENN